MTTLRRAALLGCVTLLAASVARGQTEPPPATAPAPPPAPATPLEASPPPPSTPAPGGVPGPVSPLSPTMAPDPTAPPLMLSERTTPSQAEPRPEPLTHKVWFWAAIGVVVATVAVIVVWNLASNDNSPPSTTFGNMHAF